jgi:hypothetical protein
MNPQKPMKATFINITYLTKSSKSISKRKIFVQLATTRKVQKLHAMMPLEFGTISSLFKV